MPHKFDPSISSADYLAIARKRHIAGRSNIFPELKWMMDNAAFDFGVQPRHVDLLLDPLGWSELVGQQKRQARVFLDARVNQSGNAEIGWARGEKGILYEEDFVRPYLHAAQSPNEGPGRGIGEVMWIDGYRTLVDNVICRRCPAATALLFGFAARLKELTGLIHGGVNLVGSVMMDFSYQGGHVTSVDLIPTVSSDRLQELIEEGREQRRPRLQAAIRALEAQHPSVVKEWDGPIKPR
ncbi:hypothetical protein [Mesorhizobium sp.]|uniref:hypothetical protein n=1 Tax=Mesorhizobium sp. TaxID=1871066 RepID=UPI00122729C7|nr:hypothetical protein [Mesorhizobium sp.]TIO28989.1 MAG: hypothetical protein E5X89_32635 [Mesorhizobium sp.]